MLRKSAAGKVAVVAHAGGLLDVRIMIGDKVYRDLEIFAAECSTYVWRGGGGGADEGVAGKKKKRSSEVRGAEQILSSLAPRHLEVVQLLALMGCPTMGAFKREAKKRLLVQDGKAMEGLMVELVEHGLVVRKGGKGGEEVEVRGEGLRKKVLEWKRGR